MATAEIWNVGLVPKTGCFIAGRILGSDERDM
jgi:hypothetical protein